MSGGTVSSSRKMSVQAQRHVVQRPEPPGGVTVQGDREELHEAVAGDRVEEVLG